MLTKIEQSLLNQVLRNAAELDSAVELYLYDEHTGYVALHGSGIGENYTTKTYSIESALEVALDELKRREQH